MLGMIAVTGGISRNQNGSNSTIREHVHTMTHIMELLPDIFRKGDYTRAVKLQ